MMGHYCSKEIEKSIEKILNKHDTCVFIFHGHEGIGKRTFTLSFREVCSRTEMGDAWCHLTFTKRV